MRRMAIALLIFAAAVPANADSLNFPQSCELGGVTVSSAQRLPGKAVARGMVASAAVPDRVSFAATAATARRVPVRTVNRSPARSPAKNWRTLNEEAPCPLVDGFALLAGALSAPAEALAGSRSYGGTRTYGGSAHVDGYIRKDSTSVTPEQLKTYSAGLKRAA